MLITLTLLILTMELTESLVQEQTGSQFRMSSSLDFQMKTEELYLTVLTASILLQLIQEPEHISQKISLSLPIQQDEYIISSHTMVSLTI